jgi:chemotaxis protein MotB
VPRKKEKAPAAGAGMGWLVTFADLMTLLLTFFVLLLSMATMDRSILREISVSVVGVEGLAPKKGAGKVPVKFEIVQKAIENPASVFEEMQRIKDVLFPEEVLPEGMAKSTLDENLDILVRPEGIALVLSDELLFATGQSELAEDRKKILSTFVEFLAAVPAPVNVGGYTDNVPGGAKDNYTLSAERAMSVLGYFLELGFEPERFSVSAYGEAFPLADNDTPEGRAKNRRVEILMKTTTRSYL